MIAAARDWWAGRSDRERWLLGVMLALFGVVLMWFGMIVPIARGLDDAHARHSQAVVTLASVQAKATALKKLTAAPPPPLGAPVTSVLALAAGEAGFTLTRNDVVGTDAASISIVSAKTPAFFDWVSMLDRRGIFVERITIRPNSDATIAIEATFKARAS